MGEEQKTVGKPFKKAHGIWASSKMQSNFGLVYPEIQDVAPGAKILFISRQDIFPDHTGKAVEYNFYDPEKHTICDSSIFNQARDNLANIILSSDGFLEDYFFRKTHIATERSYGFDNLLNTITVDSYDQDPTVYSLKDYLGNRNYADTFIIIMPDKPLQRLALASLATGLDASKYSFQLSGQGQNYFLNILAHELGHVRDHTRKTPTEDITHGEVFADIQGSKIYSLWQKKGLIPLDIVNFEIEALRAIASLQGNFNGFTLNADYLTGYTLRNPDFDFDPQSPDLDWYKNNHTTNAGFDNSANFPTTLEQFNLNASAQFTDTCLEINTFIDALIGFSYVQEEKENIKQNAGHYTEDEIRQMESLPSDVSEIKHYLKAFAELGFEQRIDNPDEHAGAFLALHKISFFKNTYEQAAADNLKIAMQFVEDYKKAIENIVPDLRDSDIEEKYTQLTKNIDNLSMLPETPPIQPQTPPPDLQPKQH